jgi:hypothetical protein
MGIPPSPQRHAVATRVPDLGETCDAGTRPRGRPRPRAQTPSRSAHPHAAGHARRRSVDVLPLPAPACPLPVPIEPGEARLAYVAVTRAQHHLDLGGLSWINRHPAPRGLGPTANLTHDRLAASAVDAVVGRAGYPKSVGLLRTVPEAARSIILR